jgi:hypothetical protein
MVAMLLFRGISPGGGRGGKVKSGSPHISSALGMLTGSSCLRPAYGACQLELRIPVAGYVFRDPHCLPPSLWESCGRSEMSASKKKLRRAKSSTKTRLGGHMNQLSLKDHLQKISRCNSFVQRFGWAMKLSICEARHPRQPTLTPLASTKLLRLTVRTSAIPPEQTGSIANDEIEAMLAVQMVATHLAATRALRRLKGSDTVSQQDSNGNLAVKLLSRLHQLRGLSGAKPLKSLGRHIKSRHYMGERSHESLDVVSSHDFRRRLSRQLELQLSKQER